MKHKNRYVKNLHRKTTFQNMKPFPGRCFNQLIQIQLSEIASQLWYQNNATSSGLNYEIYTVAASWWMKYQVLNDTCLHFSNTTSTTVFRLYITYIIQHTITTARLLLHNTELFKIETKISLEQENPFKYWSWTTFIYIYIYILDWPYGSVS